MKYGDIDAAFAKAAHVFKDRIFQHRGGPFFIETRGLDRHVRRGDVERSPRTSPARARTGSSARFMDMLDLGDNQVRVIAPEVGGGFGPKGSFYCEYAAVPPRPWRSAGR